MFILPTDMPYVSHLFSLLILFCLVRADPFVRFFFILLLHILWLSYFIVLCTIVLPFVKISSGALFLSYSVSWARVGTFLLNFAVLIILNILLTLARGGAFPFAMPAGL
jgi:hypothetical protein